MGTIDLHARRDLMRLYWDGERISPHMPVTQPEPSTDAKQSLCDLVDTGAVVIAIDRVTPPMFAVTDSGQVIDYQENDQRQS